MQHCTISVIPWLKLPDIVLYTSTQTHGKQVYTIDINYLNIVKFKLF